MGKLNQQKILFLITKSNWGGAQRYVYDLATSLPGDKFEVAVALGGTDDPQIGSDENLQIKLNGAGVTVFPISSLQRDISIYKEIRSFFEISLLIRRFNPDVLHINSSKAGGIGAFLGRALFVPRVIFTAHGWAFNEDRPGWQKPILKFFHWLTVFFTHETIAVSKALKSQMDWPLVQDKMTIVHNGRRSVDFLSKTEARETLAEYAPALKKYQNDIWTGTIGELHPVKQHEVMIESVARIITTDDLPLRHVIISGGELRKKLEKLIIKKGLQNFIFLTGRINEAARLLKAFDIYVQPSRSEALAYTVIEAAQAGLPIIASDVGGLPEVIDHAESGLLIPSGNSEALCTAIVENMLNNKDKMREYAEAAKAKSSLFSLEAMIKKTVAVYEDNTSRTL